MKNGSVAKRLLSAFSLASNSCGIPGSTYTFSICTVGNRMSPASLSTAPSVTSAIRSAASSERPRKCSRIRLSSTGFITSGRLNARATPSIVRSSWVGPTPPEVITKSKLREQYATSPPIRSRSSGIVAIRASATPRLRSSRAPKHAFESWTLPERISLPTPTSAQLRSRIDVQLLARSASTALSQAAPISGNGVDKECLRRPGALDVGRRRLDKLFQPPLEPSFYLPHPLAADSETRADFLQRLGILRQQARIEYLPLLARERVGELLDLVVGEVAPFAIRGLGLGIVPGVGDHVEQPRIVVLAAAGRLIERDLALPHPLLHLAHVALAHAHPMRQQQRLRLVALALEPFSLLAQIEEELALRLGSADFHQPPVVDQVAVDVGAHPPHGVRRKADSMFGVEILDRFHQADVALLDKVEHVPGRARELVRKLHYQPQIGGDQPVRIRGILVLHVAARDHRLLLAREQREAANLSQAAAERIGCDQRAAFFLGVRVVNVRIGGFGRRIFAGAFYRTKLGDFDWRIVIFVVDRLGVVLQLGFFRRDRLSHDASATNLGLALRCRRALASCRFAGFARHGMALLEPSEASSRVRLMSDRSRSVRRRVLRS